MAGNRMRIRSFWALVALLSLVVAGPVLAQQAPPGYYQAPPQYQPPPPQYQQPPPQYQQQPPQYQQPPPQYPPPAAPPQYYPPPPPPPGQPAPTYTQSTYTQPQNAFRYHALRMELAGGYTLTEGDLKNNLHDGGNVGLGFIWMPSSSFPLGLRLEGSYSDFSHTPNYLSQEAAASGYDLSSGYTALYGGNADAELDLPMLGNHVREYLFGGVGWYRQQINLKAVSNQQGLVCYYYCVPVTFPVYSTVSRTTTDWQKAWNAGIGFEFAMADPGSFFIEARYMRITQNQGDAQTVFVPIRIGIRF